MNLVLAYWEMHDPALTSDTLEEAMPFDLQEPNPHPILAEQPIGKDNLAAAAIHLAHVKEQHGETDGERQMKRSRDPMTGSYLLSAPGGGA